MTDKKKTQTELEWNIIVVFLTLTILAYTIFTNDKGLFYVWIGILLGAIFTRD